MERAGQAPGVTMERGIAAMDHAAMGPAAARGVISFSR